MKRFLLAFLLVAPVALAQQPNFPGLRSIMSAEEFQRAGLDRLSPDQLKAVNSAIVRHYTGTVETVAEQKAEKIAEKKAVQIAEKKIAEHEKKGLLSGFGLPAISFNQDWRDQPGLKGKVVGWVGGNSFKLDNGQVWEGLEPIPFELVNREVEISPRPANGFALIVEGKNTTVRVKRIR